MLPSPDLYLLKVGVWYLADPAKPRWTRDKAQALQLPKGEAETLAAHYSDRCPNVLPVDSQVGGSSISTLKSEIGGKG